MNQKKIVMLPFIAAVAAAGIVFCISRGRTATQVVVTDPQTEKYEYPSASAVFDDGTAEGIWVYVSGCIREPGVYFLDEGARVFEAIEMAGGVDENAAQDSLNLAETLTDGQHIYVPDIREVQAGTDIFQDAGRNPEAVMPDGMVNINTATAQQLMSLPGIGETRAQAIIDYREQKRFETIEEIMNVSGIKEKLFSRIKDRIKV